MFHSNDDFIQRNFIFDADGFEIPNASSYWKLIKLAKSKNLKAIDVKASRIDENKEKKMTRPMGKSFDQHYRSPFSNGLKHIHLDINEWLVLIQTVFNHDNEKKMKLLSSRSFGEDMKFPVQKPMRYFTADKAARPDTTRDVKNAEPSSEAAINDDAGSIYETMQKAALKFVPVPGRPPSLLGLIPSALKDAGPLVSASRGTLIASTSWSSALLLALMLVSLRLLLMLTDVTTLKDGKKVDVREERLWKPLILP